MLAKGPAGSRSILNQDMKIRICYCKNMSETCEGSVLCEAESTCGRCDCLASLLLSLADSTDVFSSSGVRGTGKASPRGSQHTTDTAKSKISPRHLSYTNLEERCCAVLAPRVLSGCVL